MVNENCIPMGIARQIVTDFDFIADIFNDSDKMDILSVLTTQTRYWENCWVEFKLYECQNIKMSLRIDALSGEFANVNSVYIKKDMFDKSVLKFESDMGTITFRIAEEE